MLREIFEFLSDEFKTIGTEYGYHVRTHWPNSGDGVLRFVIEEPLQNDFDFVYESFGYLYSSYGELPKKISVSLREDNVLLIRSKQLTSQNFESKILQFDLRHPNSFEEIIKWFHEFLKSGYQ